MQLSVKCIVLYFVIFFKIVVCFDTLQRETIILAKPLEKRGSKKTTSVSLTVSPTVLPGAVPTESSYVDIYGCKPASMNVTDYTDIAKAKYGCGNEAYVSYLIYIGEQSVSNLTYMYNNNDTYTKYYNNFLKAYQEYLSSTFDDWFVKEKGYTYYSCPAKTCAYSTALFGGRGTTKVSYNNMYLPEANMEPALKSMSTYFNTTITKDQIGQADASAHAILYENKIKNVTMPVAAYIDENPMSMIGASNITNLANLVATAKDNLGKTDPLTLINFLTPVITYGQLSREVETFYTEGKEITAEMKKEKIAMALGIVFAFLSVATMFLDAIEAVIAVTAIGIADTFSSFALTGQLNVLDVVSIVGGAISPLFRIMSEGRAVAEASNSFMMLKHSDLGTMLAHFGDYADPVSSLFSVNISPGANS